MTHEQAKNMQELSTSTKFFFTIRWKKYLTLFQIVQFILLFGQGTIFLLGYALDMEYAKCGYPWQMSALGLAILYGPFLIMFSKFYSAAYTKSSSKKDK